MVRLELPHPRQSRVECRNCRETLRDGRDVITILPHEIGQEDGPVLGESLL